MNKECVYSFQELLKTLSILYPAHLIEFTHVFIGENGIERANL